MASMEELGNMVRCAEITPRIVSARKFESCTPIFHLVIIGSFESSDRIADPDHASTTMPFTFLTL
jgi:hypothetical protein